MPVWFWYKKNVSDSTTYISQFIFNHENTVAREHYITLCTAVKYISKLISKYVRL